jgi:hypothetical protein
MTFTGRVLALDLATTTGWAHGAPGSAPACGHIRFTKQGSTRAQTYRVFRKWLDDEWGVRDHIPEVIVYESPAVPSFLGGRTNIETTRLLFGLAEHLEEWCYGKTELHEATTSQVRCHFLGQNLKAKIAKPLTLERCRDFGWEVATEDEADAAALWDYTQCWLNPQLAYKTTPLFRKKVRPTTL